MFLKNVKTNIQTSPKICLRNIWMTPLAAERTILYNIAIVQTSNLIHKVLVLDRTEHMSVRTGHPNLPDRNKSGPCINISMGFFTVLHLPLQVQFVPRTNFRCFLHKGV